MSSKMTQYKLEAAGCEHCGRPPSYVFGFGIPTAASNMMAAVRAATGVGHQDTSYKSHLDLADRFEVIVNALTSDAGRYSQMITPAYDRWHYFGQTVDGINGFTIEARKLKDATVEITYPDES